VCLSDERVARIGGSRAVSVSSDSLPR
jgi:hypothetical protein